LEIQFLNCILRKFFIIPTLEQVGNFTMIFKTNSMFIILGLLGIGTNCLAGLPEVDPAVKYLQDQFKKGRTPSLEVLQLGARWTCTTYYATAKFTNQKLGPFPKYQFSEQNGLIYVGDLTFKDGSAASSARYYAFDEVADNLSGMNSTGSIINYLRSVENNLVLESVELKTPEPNVSSPSISDPQYLVYAYSLCNAESAQEIAEIQTPTEVQDLTEAVEPTENAQVKKTIKKKRTPKKEVYVELDSEYLPLIESTEFDDLSPTQDKPVKKGFFESFRLKFGL
jgi:hypothetical protein